MMRRILVGLAVGSEITNFLVASSQFYSADGSTVDGVLGSDGLCTFPEANCGPDVAVYSCCQAKDAYKQEGGNYMFIAFAVIFIPILYLKYFSKSAEERAAAAESEEERTPSWVKHIPLRSLRMLFKYGLMVYIVMQILVPIYMRDSIQERLTVGNRNAIIAVEAFTVPYNEIFQFIEDIILGKEVGHSQAI